MGLISSRRSDPPAEVVPQGLQMDLPNRGSESVEPPPLNPPTELYSCNLHPSSPPPRKKKRNRLRNRSVGGKFVRIYTFEQFLVHRGWTFTGLKAEDDRPETSASNFMCLEIQYGRPRYVSFEPVNFGLSNQASIIMVWNVGQEDLRWAFSGSHWKDPAIRDTRLELEELHLPSATLHAMIEDLQLPIQLIDLPIGTDHRGVALNENRLIFTATKHNWIRETNTSSSV